MDREEIQEIVEQENKHITIDNIEEIFQQFTNNSYTDESKQKEFTRQILEVFKAFEFASPELNLVVNSMMAKATGTRAKIKNAIQIGFIIGILLEREKGNKECKLQPQSKLLI